MNNAIIDNVKIAVEKLLKNDNTGHDYYHTKRVYNLARKIAIKEKADVYIVSLASLLHDVDDYKIFDTYENKNNARKILNSENVCEEDINRICEIIEEVSFKGSESKEPSSIEGKCVQDADRIDALGAIGIARTFAFGGSRNRPIYDPLNRPIMNMTKEEYQKRSSTSTSINHFYEKLLLLKDMMTTSEGKRIACERHDFMITFLNEFYKEWNE